MEPTKTISKVKAIHLMEGENVSVSFGGAYFTGLILEMSDGRILVQASTDVIQPFSEMVPEHKDYQQLKALLA